MGIDSVHVRWAQKRQFIAWDEAGHSIVMDAASAHAGEGTGTRPLQVFLYGLAGCTGMDVISILEKKRQDVRDLEIRVTAHQRTDEYPKIYTRIELHFIVEGNGVQPAAVARAIELSEGKYCSVKGMLGEHVEIVASYEVREARAAGTALLSPEP